MSGVHLGVEYRESPITGVTMYDPTEVYTNDCRDRVGGEPFISVRFQDENNCTVKAYLPPHLAVELHQQLDVMLCPQEAKCTNCGNPLASERIDGHEVAFCPTCGDQEPKGVDDGAIHA